MRCPYCGTLDNRVIDSRLSGGGEVTRRRRQCASCERRYTTYERFERALPWVKKSDGGRQPFARDKIMAGLQRACVKRDISPETLERLVDQLERQLSESGESEVTSHEIGDRLLRSLRRLDEVAYVRFASVYRKFTDAPQFMAELSALLAENEPEA